MIEILPDHSNNDLLIQQQHTCEDTDKEVEVIYQPTKKLPELHIYKKQKGIVIHSRRHTW